MALVERRAFKIARFAVHNDQEALDIVQDAMMKLVQRYSTRPETEWRRLFFRILESRIMDWHRRQKVRNRWRLYLDKFGFTEADDDDGSIDQFPDQQSRQPWQQLHDHDSIDHLSIELEQLPLRQQQAFLLRAWEGLSVADTASAMECSISSVKTHYSRAIHRLRHVLEEYAP